MKKQIRYGVFETNSSSTHSLTMCTKSDYDKWVRGEVLLFKGSDWSYTGDIKPVHNQFYSKEEAIELLKTNKYLLGEDVSSEEEDLLSEYEWFTYDSYSNDDLEWFRDEFTTKSGETIIAFGEYGCEG